MCMSERPSRLSHKGSDICMDELLGGFTVGLHYWKVVNERRQVLLGGARGQCLWWLALGMGQFCMPFLLHPVM